LPALEVAHYPHHPHHAQSTLGVDADTVKAAGAKKAHQSFHDLQIQQKSEGIEEVALAAEAVAKNN
jgi:hypothetical protein